MSIKHSEIVVGPKIGSFLKMGVQYAVRKNP